jgi:NADPH2:quinone reductase
MGVKFFLVYDLSPADRLNALARLTDLLSRQQLVHSIGARFSLDQIAQAHRTVEAGQTVGNVVVEL